MHDRVGEVLEEKDDFVVGRANLLFLDGETVDELEDVGRVEVLPERDAVSPVGELSLVVEADFLEDDPGASGVLHESALAVP